MTTTKGRGPRFFQSSLHRALFRVRQRNLNRHAPTGTSHKRCAIGEYQYAAGDLAFTDSGKVLQHRNGRQRRNRRDRSIRTNISSSNSCPLESSNANASLEKASSPPLRTAAAAAAAATATTKVTRKEQEPQQQQQQQRIQQQPQQLQVEEPHTARDSFSSEASSSTSPSSPERPVSFPPKPKERTLVLEDGSVHPPHDRDAKDSQKEHTDTASEKKKKNDDDDGDGNSHGKEVQSRVPLKRPRPHTEPEPRGNLTNSIATLKVQLQRDQLVWVTQGKTEHLARVVDVDIDVASDSESESDTDAGQETTRTSNRSSTSTTILIRWSANNLKEYVPLSSVRVLEDETPKRRSKRPRYLQDGIVVDDKGERPNVNSNSNSNRKPNRRRKPPARNAASSTNPPRTTTTTMTMTTENPTTTTMVLNPHRGHHRRLRLVSADTEEQTHAEITTTRECESSTAAAEEEEAAASLDVSAVIQTIRYIRETLGGRFLGLRPSGEGSSCAWVVLSRHQATRRVVRDALCIVSLSSTEGVADADSNADSNGDADAANDGTENENPCDHNVEGNGSNEDKDDRQEEDGDDTADDALENLWNEGSFLFHEYTRVEATDRDVLMGNGRTDPQHHPGNWLYREILKRFLSEPSLEADPLRVKDPLPNDVLLGSSPCTTTGSNEHPGNEAYTTIFCQVVNSNDSNRRLLGREILRRFQDSSNAPPRTISTTTTPKHRRRVLVIASEIFDRVLQETGGRFLTSVGTASNHDRAPWRILPRNEAIQIIRKSLCSVGVTNHAGDSPLVVPQTQPHETPPPRRCSSQQEETPKGTGDSSSVNLVPTVSDVLCGESSPLRDTQHQGNRRFQSLLASFAEPYDASTCGAEKATIARTILATVQSHGGRFLVQTTSSDGTRSYEPMIPTEACIQVRRAFLYRKQEVLV